MASVVLRQHIKYTGKIGKRFDSATGAHHLSFLYKNKEGGILGFYFTGGGGPVKLDSMWQHRLTRLVRDRYMYSIRITV